MFPIPYSSSVLIPISYQKKTPEPKANDQKVVCLNCEGSPEYIPVNPKIDPVPLRCTDYDPMFPEDPRIWSCQKKDQQKISTPFMDRTDPFYVDEE